MLNCSDWLSCRKCAEFSPEEMRPQKSVLQYLGCKLYSLLKSRGYLHYKHVHVYINIIIPRKNALSNNVKLAKRTKCDLFYLSVTIVILDKQTTRLLVRHERLQYTIQFSTCVVTYFVSISNRHVNRYMYYTRNIVQVPLYNSPNNSVLSIAANYFYLLNPLIILCKWMVMT